MHEGTEQFMAVDAIYWHESYDYQTFDYDIMLMKLAHPVAINEFVKPVALPKACPTPGDMCMVSGWGNIYTDQGEMCLILENNLLFLFGFFSLISDVLLASVTAGVAHE